MTSAAVRAQFARLRSLPERPDRVSFTDIVQIEQLARRSPELVDVDTVQTTLLARFTAEHGALGLRYSAQRGLGGAAVVQPPDTAAPWRLETVCNAHDPRLIAIETRCREIADQLAELAALSPSVLLPVRNAVVALYAVMTEVLALADDEHDLVHQPPADAAPARARFEQGVASAQASLVAAMTRAQVIGQRATRSTYLVGVGLGTVATLVLVGLLGWLTGRFWSAHLSASALTVATTFGVFGAVVSVFQRISKGSLVLDVTAGRTELVALATLRPVVGAISAAVAELALGAGLFAAGTPTATTSVGSFAVIGFVAGFSERFAVDAAERAGKVLAGVAATDQVGAGHPQPATLPTPIPTPAAPPPPATPPGGGTLTT